MKILGNFKEISKNSKIRYISNVNTGIKPFLINQLQIKNNLSTTEVLSPTFNILNEYKVDNLTIKHFDLYRIKSKDELANLGLFEEKEDVNLIEWPEIINIKDVKKIELHFSYNNNFKNRNLLISSNFKSKLVDEFK